VQPLEERVIEGKGPNKILLLDVSGIISEERQSKGMGFKEETSMVDRFKEELKKAESDKTIQGILVRINSPGGTVTASDIIYHELREFKQKTGVKVIAALMDTATSGGYYVAVAADSIIAHPTTITGSIGVIALKFNVQELLSKIGVEEESITSGDKKDLMSPFRPTTPEEREILQTIIDKLYHRFIEVIDEGRPSLTHAAIARIADGRIFTSDQALEAKLIDGIGYLDDTINMMKDDLGIQDASIVVYCRPGSYKGTIYSKDVSSARPTFNLISINGKGLSVLPDVRLMYLWMP
jgi:protease-4